MRLEDSLNKILIIDFGSQFTQLIARKIRESNVHSIILPFDYSRNLIEKYNVKGIILSGGPSSVYEDDAPSLPATIFDYNIPILGICYGHQILSKNLGGEVKSSQKTVSGRVAYANSITLTPGTVTIQMDDETLEVHALSPEMAEDIKSGFMDKKVSQLEIVK